MTKVMKLFVVTKQPNTTIFQNVLPLFDMELKFKKIEFHKKCHIEVDYVEPSWLQCVTRVYCTRVPCKKHFPVPTALTQSTIALTQPQLLTYLPQLHAFLSLFIFFFFQLLSIFFSSLASNFVFYFSSFLISFQVWVSLFSFFCQGHVGWEISQQL